jgi:hypothetical protein
MFQVLTRLLPLVHVSSSSSALGGSVANGDVTTLGNVTNPVDAMLPAAGS